MLPPSWSPPVFFRLGAFGVGLTLGYAHVESMLLLSTQEDVEMFATEKARLPMICELYAGRRHANHREVVQADGCSPAVCLG